MAAHRARAQTTVSESAASVSSMTGFARVDGEHGETRWSWELKSVNSRGLETRFRLPPGFDFLEPSLKKRLSAKISRGSVNVSLMLRAAKSTTVVQVNEPVLDQIIPLIDMISLRVDCEKPRAENILNLRGVLDMVEPAPDEAEQAALGDAMTASFETSVGQLKSARIEEGRAMAAVLTKLVDETETLANAARASDDARLSVIRDRVATQLQELGVGEALNDDRLAQEAALLAVKADIREELDRLDAHVAAARALLGGSGPLGRKLDFLTQEFNREANTLCSKAPSMALKQIGLDLKSVIDQMREQVQNVE